MKLSVVFKGLKKINQQLDKMQSQIDKPAVQALGQAALIIHSHAVKSIQSKDGIPKRVGGKTIIVSKPGEPPNTQTGRLIRSIRWTLNKSERTATVGSKLNYASWLEFGWGPNPDKVRRPWLRPAFKNNFKVITELYTRAIQRAIKEYSK